MAAQYSANARAAVSLAFLATQSACNGNIQPLPVSLAIECAGDALACLVTQRTADFAARCTLAHKATAEAYHWAHSAGLEQSELLRWRVAFQAWALAADMVKGTFESALK
jgi:hypothetical protein